MLEGLLPHRLRVWRDTGQRDRFGQRDIQVTQTGGHLGIQGMSQTATDIRCRLTSATGGMQEAERSQLVFFTNYTLFVENGADIREDDRLQVYDPVHGDVLLADGIVKLIRKVYALGTQHHIEVKLQNVRGPQ